MSKIEKVLEFNKIKEKLAGFAKNPVCELFVCGLKPEIEFKRAREKCEQTSHAIELQAQKSLPDASKLRDVRDFVKHAQKGGVLGIEQIYYIGALLGMAHSFIKYFENDGFSDFIIEDLRELRKAIKDVFLDENSISDNASGDLAQIRRAIVSRQGKIRSELEKFVVQKSKYLQESIISVRGEAYVIPVKAEFKGQIKGIVHDISATGATLFIEPNFIVELHNEIAKLKREEDAEVQRILAEFSVRIADEGSIIWRNFESVSEIDFIFTKAEFALATGSYVPNINDKKHIKIVNGRHPLIDSERVVPISLELGDGIKTLVITGPNTGGKTVTLKTVGLFCMMAASGLAIPADSNSTIPIFQQIFADIGDEQSIEQNLSTFSSHIKNISGILKKVNENSLVLLDELGAGTDPDEGAALAIAILEHTKARGAVTLATTHYSQLKLYGMSQRGAANASCEFDVETLKPTYKLIFGVPGKSNAFAISSRLGIFPEIIVRAKEELNSKHEKFEKAVRNLHSKTQRLSNLSSEKMAKNAEIEKIKKQYEDKLAKLNEKYDNEIAKAKREAKAIIKRAGADADRIIAELKQKPKDAIKAKAKLNEMLGENEEVIFIPNELLGRSAVRQHQVVNSSRQAEVRSEKLEMRESLLELDVRGKYALDAVMDAEGFIDNAVMRGLSAVSIIHGKGTGALRTEIHKMLKTNKSVAGFRLGTFGEGETGVTIIELR